MNESSVGRRAILLGGVALALSETRGVLGEVQGEADPSVARPREGDWLVKVGDATATPMTPDDVPAGVQTMAWPVDPMDRTVRSGSRLNRIMLVRVEPEKLSAETRSRAAGGVVAYTAICTHTGCEVIEWLADDQLLYCPCHYSKFDPRDGARVVDGPAPRALPALPLKTLDGKLVVAKPFLTRVGFEQP